MILGFGGHAKSVADSILRIGKFNVAGYTDMVDYGCGVQYLGTDDKLEDIFEGGVRKAVLGVGFMGNSFVRDSLIKIVKKIGYELPAIIDPTAAIAYDAVIGEGAFVGKNAVVNAGSVVGNCCIVNTGAIIEHDNVIGDCSHIAIGAALCGNVNVGHHSMIGANATVIQGRRIGSNCIVGANSTVIKDVEDGMKVYGIVANWGGYSLVLYLRAFHSFRCLSGI